MATKAFMQRRTLRGHTVQCWLGHVVNLFQLNPECLAALSACYRFADMSLNKLLKVWPSVRTEMRWAMRMGLLFFTEVNLGAEFPLTFAAVTRL